jgi:PAS domain S-box-containing protein
MEKSWLPKNYHKAFFYLFTAVAYLLLSWLNWVAFKRAGILPMPIWPAAGFSVAVALFFGIHAVPGVFLGSLMANSLALGADLELALLISITNSLAPYLAAKLFCHLGKGQSPFSDTASYATFILAAVILHPILTASGGAFSQLALAKAGAQQLTQIWTGWWLAHACGTLLFAPLFLALADISTEKQQNMAEFVTILALTTVAATTMFFRLDPFPLGLPYLLVLPMTYIAFRHSILRTMTLFTIVILTGMTGIIFNPSEKSDPVSVINQFRIMAVTYSFVLLLLAVMRKKQLQIMETLQKSEKQYRRLTENSPAIMFQYKQNIDGNPSFTFINQSIYTLTGIKPEEVVHNADSLLNLILAEDMALFKKELEQSARELTPFHISLKFKKSEQIFWVEVFSTPERMEDGSILWDGLILDITERKNADENLLEKQNLLTGLIENSGALIFIKNLRGEYLLTNRQWEKVTGLSKAAVVGKTDQMLFPAIDAEKFLNIDQQVMNTGVSIETEEVLHTPEGKKHFISIKFPLLNAENQISGLCGIVTEITERKRIEEELRNKTLELENYFSSALDLLCIADTDGNFIRVNQEWENVLGYKAEDLQKSKFLDFVHPDDIPATIKTINQLNLQQKVIDFTNRYRCKDGSYRFIEWRSTPHGRLIYAAARDITERIKERESLLKTQFAMDKSFYSILWVDENATIVYINDQACRSLGFSREEILGKQVFFIDPDFKPEGWAEHKNKMRKYGSLRFESRHLRKDGSIFPVEIYSNYFEYEGKYFSCAFDRDITEQKQAEEALKASEKRAKNQREAIAKILLDRIFSSSDLALIINHIVELLAKTIEAARASVWFLSEDNQKLICQNLYDSAAKTHTKDDGLAVESFPEYFTAIMSEHRIFAENAQSDPRTIGLSENYLCRLGITSLLDVGIIIEGRLIGVVSCEHIGPPRKWFADEEAFVSNIS